MRHLSALLLVVLLPTGCWREPLGDAPPSIERLDASPTTFALGEQVVVSWQVTGAHEVTLEGPGERWEDLDLEGSVTLLPTATGTQQLVLTAVGSGGRAEGTVDFEVTDPSLESRPEIHLFLAEPGEIEPGGESQLRWRVDRATRIWIEASDETSFDVEEATGERLVQPAETTTYTLKAEGPGGVSDKEARVVVRRPLIAMFVADREEIKEGEPVTLTWQTRFAERVTIEPAVAEGELSVATGSVIVTPAPGEHTWTLTASGTGPDATASVSLVVLAIPTVVRFEVQPTEAVPGDLVRLFWETSGSDAVAITQTPGDDVLELERAQEIDGHVLVAGASTTFTLVAVGPGGESEPAEATLTVHERPIVDRFVSTPPELALGAAASLGWETTNATSVVIDPPVSDEPLLVDGVAEIRPAVDTEYRMTATGPGGETSAAVTVRVFPPPTIDRFEASAEQVAPDSAVTLTWETTGATAVILEPPPALGLPPDRVDGSVDVRPEEDTIYVLTARGPGGEVRAQVEVTVFPPPRIVRFIAAPESVPLGAATTLTWETENVDSVLIEPDVGVADLPVSGTIDALPAVTGNYSLTATGQGGQVVATAWVVVIPNPTIDSLTIDPDTIALGETATLSWSVRGALRVWFDPGPGIVEDEFEATREVQPDETVNYVLHATNGGGERTASVTIVVEQPPRVVRFEPEPATIMTGATSRLHWELIDAESVEIRDELDRVLDLGAEAVAAGSVEVAPLRTTSYTLTAEGTGGALPEPAEATLTVTAARLKLSEVMFDPRDGSDQNLQWIELYNPNDVEVPLQPYAIGIGGADWKRPAFQLTGTLAPGGCFVVGGPQSHPDNGEPVFDQPKAIQPAIEDEPFTASVVGIFFSAWTRIGSYDLDLVPLDAVLFGHSNRTQRPGEQEILQFLGADGQPMPVHVPLYEIDDQGNIRRDGGRPVRLYEHGQSLTRRAPGAEEWQFSAPSPGVCFDSLRLTGLEPDNAPNVDDVEVLVRGGGFAAGTTFSFGGVQPFCVIERVDLARCTLPARGGGPSIVNVTASVGEAQVTLDQAWTFTGVADDIDWCQIQHPVEAVEVDAGGETEELFGRVFDAGTTPGEGQGDGLDAQVGLGPDGSDPQQSADWRWTDAEYNGDLLNANQELADDEYRATLLPVAAGEADWAWRFSYDGIHWLYCDGEPGHGPAGAEAAGAYDPADAGVLIVH